MRPFSWLAAALLAGMTLAVGAGGAGAQSFPRMLEDVKVFSEDNREVVQLTLSQPYQGQPVVERRPGTVAINLSVTGARNSGKSFQFPGSKVLREIRVVQNRSSTTVTLFLKSRRDALAGTLSFEPRGKHLNVIPPTPGAAAATLSARDGGTLGREMEGSILGKPGAGQGAAAAATTRELGGLADSGMVGPLLTMLVGLVIVIAALYLVLFLYNRYVAGRFSRPGEALNIRQLASFHIGPRQRVVVLDIEGEVVACGVTPSQISYLTRLEGTGAGLRARTPQAPAPRSDAPAPPSQGGDAPSAGAPAAPGKGDAVTQFAEALKEKVRSLKRIN